MSASATTVTPLARLAAAQPGLPGGPAWHAWRAAALQRLLAHGLPTPRDDAWKYTQPAAARTAQPRPCPAAPARDGRARRAAGRRRCPARVRRRPLPRGAVGATAARRLRIHAVRAALRERSARSARRRARRRRRQHRRARAHAERLPRRRWPVTGGRARRPARRPGPARARRDRRRLLPAHPHRARRGRRARAARGAPVGGRRRRGGGLGWRLSSRGRRRALPQLAAGDRAAHDPAR